MSKKLEEALNQKLSSKTSKNFDKDFWQKFNKEKKPRKIGWFSMMSATAAIAVFVFVVSWQFQNTQVEKTVAEIRNEEAEILADLDEQDWEILLGEDYDS